MAHMDRSLGAARAPDGLEELLGHARAGDAQAFGELLDRLRPELLAAVESWIGPGVGRLRVAAEDVVQDACLRAFRARHRLRAGTGAGFRAWVRRIARNRLFDLWQEGREEQRALGTKQELEEGEELETVLPARTPSSLGDLELAERRARLRAGLQRLGAEERLVLLLRELLELPWKTTAHLLGRPSVKAARSLHARTCAKVERSPAARRARDSCVP